METVKVLVLGATKSGKTSLIARLINEKMPTLYRPTIETFSTTKHKTVVENKEKTYLLHFFEVGSHNDLLYKLYAVMCDVFVVAVDSTNPMASQDALLMLDKIRCLSPDNDRLSVLTVTTKFEGSNSEASIPDLRNIYPNIITSARLNVGIEDVKSQIIKAKLGKKPLQRTMSARLTVKDRIKVSLQKRETRRINKRMDKELDRLSSSSGEELATYIDNHTRSCPPSPALRQRNACPSSSLISQPSKPRLSPMLDLLEKDQTTPLMSFTESQMLTSPNGNKKFFHACHLIEVPPIIFETPKPKGYLNRLTDYAGNLKERLSGIITGF